nr:MAG TPA: hypothetical protein [Caudoviricetes sp.]
MATEPVKLLRKTGMSLGWASQRFLFLRNKQLPT